MSERLSCLKHRSKPEQFQIPQQFSKIDYLKSASRVSGPCPGIIAKIPDHSFPDVCFVRPIYPWKMLASLQQIAKMIAGYRRLESFSGASAEHFQQMISLDAGGQSAISDNPYCLSLLFRSMSRPCFVTQKLRALNSLALRRQIHRRIGRCHFPILYPLKGLMTASQLTFTRLLLQVDHYCNGEDTQDWGPEARCITL